MIAFYLCIGLFFGIMIPTFFISVLPRLSIKILELCRFYKPGKLMSKAQDYITGAGYYRHAKTYMFRDENGSVRLESGRVFGFLILIFLPISLIFSLLVYFISPFLK